MYNVLVDDTHPQVRKLFELKEKYKLATNLFRKPFPLLIKEAMSGEVTFEEVFFEGAWWPCAKRKTAVLEMTHLTQSGQIWRLGEMSRRFTNGDVERRFPPGEELLRETVRSQDGENPFNTVIRLLAEEVEIYDVDLAMLEPVNEALFRAFFKSVIRVRGQKISERKKSFAYEGFISEYDLILFSYFAPQRHFRDGNPIQTEDNGVIIDAQWYRVD